MASLVSEETHPVVKIENVEKVYKIGEIPVRALRGINMELYKGEFVSIMGASGSGKTTLLNLIGVLDTPTKGKIYIDGKELSTLKEKELTQLRRYKTGFIFQFYNLIPVLTAFENVELPMLIAGVPKKEREERARELLELVGLADRGDHRPDELSGGEQQRVAIVRSLANRPSIVLADEPTGDLDTKTGYEVMHELRRLSQLEGATVIIVTHDPEVAKMSSRIYTIQDGRFIRIEKLVRDEKIVEVKLEPETGVDLSLHYTTAAMRPTTITIQEEESSFKDKEPVIRSKEEDVMVPEWLVRMTEKLKSEKTEKTQSDKKE